ncbi:hypothetical protein A4R35_21055 [Thermogemmatispora tikiterensis]|uniref:Uncharacterized protein n=1 Tax=Thermogemmatispora tikiterensis TaxID=1825093 RepID=A0A328VPC6_9CHLR|nr:hypothetical protein A4R35_21055 [Thermogemmatispora tikiterensis]
MLLFLAHLKAARRPACSRCWERAGHSHSESVARAGLTRKGRRHEDQGWSLTGQGREAGADAVSSDQLVTWSTDYG